MFVRDVSEFVDDAGPLLTNSEVRDASFTAENVLFGCVNCFDGSEVGAF